MEAQNKDNLYLYFQKNIDDEVGVIVEKLESDIAKMTYEAEAAIKQEVEEEQNNSIEVHRQELARGFQDQLATLRRQLDLSIMNKRNALIEELFTRLHRRLSAFTKDKEYDHWISEKILMIDLENCKYIEIDEDDHTIARYFPKIDVRTKKDLIGGFIFYTNNGKMIIDHSFYGRIEEARAWFYNHSQWFSKRGI